MAKTATEQFTARIDSRLYQHMKRLAEREGRSTNEIVNLLLKLGLIELSKKAARSTPQPPCSHNRNE